MAFDAIITGFLQQGTAASRPIAPNEDHSTLSFYYSSDTKVLSYYDWNTAAWVDVPGSATQNTLVFVIDGAGSALSTGIAGDIGPFDFDLTLEAVTLLADQSGSVQLDLWVAAYGSYPPTVANTIVAAAPPTITTAVKSQDTTLSGWTTAISSGDTMRVNVNSVTSIQRLTVALKYSR